MLVKRKITRRLMDSQKRLGEAHGNAQMIIEKAEAMESEAQIRVRRLRRSMAKLTGNAREIAEADYLAMLDTKQKAGKAASMARETLRRTTSARAAR